MLLQGLFAQVRGPEPHALRRGEARFGVLPHPGKEHFRSAELGHHPAKNPYRPGSGHHDLLPGLYIRPNVYGVYGHRERLPQGRHAEVESLGDGNEVLLGHHGVLGHTPVAGEANGHALGAQLRETGATGSAATAALYRDCNHSISRAYPRHTRSNRLDDTGKLVTQRYGRPDPLEPGVRPERVNIAARSEEHTSELQSRQYLVCRLLLEK